MPPMIISTLSNHEPKEILPLWICSLWVVYQSYGKVMNTSPQTQRFHSPHRNSHPLPQKHSLALWSRNSTPEASISVLDTQLNFKTGDNHSHFLCLNLMCHKERCHRHMHSTAQRSGIRATHLVNLEWTETRHSDHTADPSVYGPWPHLDSQKPT